MAAELGIRVMGSVTGIVIVLTFVGLPLHQHGENGFEAVPVRLEHVARSLGAGAFGTFSGSPSPLPGAASWSG